MAMYDIAANYLDQRLKPIQRARAKRFANDQFTVLVKCIAAYTSKYGNKSDTQLGYGPLSKLAAILPPITDGMDGNFDLLHQNYVQLNFLIIYS